MADGGPSGGGAGVTRLSLRSTLVLITASCAGFMMFAWPFFVVPGGNRVDAPFIILALLPILVILVVVEMTDNGVDSKTLAILGILTAINTAFRALSAGVAGIELVFFLLILAGRVYGPSFGFLLGSTTMFTSALVTSGVGPWLPFQMLAASWIGLGAGLLPKNLTGKKEILMLAVYGAMSAYVFGLLMNLSGWPFILGVADPGTDSTLAFVPGAAVAENLHRFFLYSLVTSTGGWDTFRAITTVLAVVFFGPAILSTLRRAAKRIHTA